mmetsp:Transcript_18781/g.34062  ORF Transcript_18781/g.34062 Transcript_18781/m.34062 type:complete len:117 (-) Transcript_18781:995-1345(-)
MLADTFSLQLFAERINDAVTERENWASQGQLTKTIFPPPLAFVVVIASSRLVRGLHSLPSPPAELRESTKRPELVRSTEELQAKAAATKARNNIIIEMVHNAQTSLHTFSGSPYSF